MGKSTSSVFIDAIIFTTVSWYLHCNDICLLGFCFPHRNYQRHHQYRTCFASYFFFTVAAFVASCYSWWAKELGKAPKGIFNIIYKLWLSVILYNFTERLVWFALYEAVSYALEFIADFVKSISEYIGSESCTDCFDFLRSDCAHHLVLVTITFHILYVYLVSDVCQKGIEQLLSFIEKKGCKDEAIAKSVTLNQSAAPCCK